MRLVDLTGKRFGRLTVIERTENKNNKNIAYRCLCDCGNESIAESSNLKGGGTKSCGCLKREQSRKLFTKHGHASRTVGRSKEYRTWQGMKNRCLNSRYDDYELYGGRGIRICNEWTDSFRAFLAYLKTNSMYPKPEGMSIDRIDNNGNYEPGNIRWANDFVQNNNQRKRSIHSTHYPTHRPPKTLNRQLWKG